MGKATPIDPDKCKHVWQDTYYGHKCNKCGSFIPTGCEPWMPTQ